MAAADCKPKLFYFDSPGLGEITRLIFTYAGKEFEDIRFVREEWDSKYKAESPLGMAPFLEDGGVKLGGSLVIARYVAEKYGLGGKNEFENAQLDSYADAMLDTLFKLHPLHTASEEKKKEECKKDLLGSLPAKFACFENQIKGADTFLDSKKTTWADILLSFICSTISKLDLGDVLKDCPKIKKVIAPIDSDEKIKAWRAKTKK